MTKISKLKPEEKKLLWEQCQAFLQVFHLILSLCIFCCIIVSICGIGWLYLMKEDGLYQDIENFVGLWQICVNLYDYGCPTESCINIGSNVEDYVQVTRAFLILASLPSLFAFIGGIAMIFSERIKGQISAICHIVTAIFLLTGMSTYTAMVLSEDLLDEFSFSWAFALGWVAFVLAILAAIIAFIFGAPKLPRVVIEFRE